MIDPITFGAGVSESGASSALDFPELGTGGIWYKGMAAPVAEALEINRQAAVARTLPEEGGAGTVAAVAPAGLQARVVFQGGWDAILIDSFEDVPFTLPECSLVLQVYEEDGETLAWEVGTAPTHSAPYLCLPENYGAQELDIIAGAATIGQVEVIVIDKAQVPGDQDSGWLTARLTSGGFPAIRGRRCRLTRYINPTLGYVVIADGPADTPRLDDSYAAYKWVIKDVRETERKIRAFTRANTWMLPMGTPEGFGPYTDPADSVDKWLVDPREPLVGTYTETELLQGVVTLDDYWDDPFTVIPQHFPSSDKVLTRDVELADAVEALGYSEVEILEMDQRAWHTWPNIELLWRPEGTEDPWTVIRPEGMHFLGGSSYPHGLVYWAGENGGVPVNGGAKLPDLTKIRAAFKIVMRLPDRDSTWGSFTLQAGDFPTEGQGIEVAMRYVGEPSEAMPLYVEYDGEARMTAGKLLKKLYDGEYSDRDPVTGDIVPTGIRYDETALLALTAPVRLRLTEVVDDLRDWAEQQIYSVTGWAPSLNADLAIHPSSQEPPPSFVGIPVLSDTNVEPVPVWNAGETIINMLEFTYPRYYRPGLTTGDAAQSVDNLETRDITVTYRSLSSVTRKEEKVTFEGTAFAAVGDYLGGPVGAETGAELAADRKLYVFDRYNYGAQTIEIPVRRGATTAAVKPGDWVVIALSWLPDYVTMRRGASWGGQVVAIHDVDCAWRVFLIEEAVPFPIS